MTPVPTHLSETDTLLSSRAEEPPDSITKEDFAAFQQQTKALRDTAPSIPFEPWPEWFDMSIGVVVKATYVKPGETTKRGGVISNGENKRFFLHSSNLRDLSGPGFMLTVDMLPFLFQKWRQPNMIVKLRAEREAKTHIIQSQQVETRTIEKKEVANPQDPETSQNCINTTDNELKSGDSSLHGSDKKENEDDEEMEEIEKDKASMQEDNGSRNNEDLVSTVAKDCGLQPPKTTYLDAVLQGKFN